MIIILLILSCAISSAVSADDKSCSGLGCVEMRGGLGVGIGSSNEESDFYYNLGAGYEVFDFMSINMDASMIKDEKDQNQILGEVYLRGYLPIESTTKLYLDAGYYGGDDNALLGVGLKKDINKNWGVSLGYRYYKEPSSKTQGDLYSMMLVAHYQFSNKDNNTVATTPKQEPKEDLGVSPTPVVSEEKDPLCENFIDNVTEVISTKDYIVVKGDWPSTISRDHCTTVEVLEKLNPWLESRNSRKEFIYPEEVLLVPSSCRVIEKDERLLDSEGVYTVVEGDWASKISKRYCVSLGELRKLNPWLDERIKREKYIYPGETMQIKE